MIVLCWVSMSGGGVIIKGEGITGRADERAVLSFSQKVLCGRPFLLVSFRDILHPKTKQENA